MTWKQEPPSDTPLVRVPPSYVASAEVKIVPISTMFKKRLRPGRGIVLASAAHEAAGNGAVRGRGAPLKQVLVRGAGIHRPRRPGRKPDDQRRRGKDDGRHYERLAGRERDAFLVDHLADNHPRLLA